MSDKKSKLLHNLMPLLVVFLGLVLMSVLVASRKQPPKEKPSFPGVIVKVMTAELEDRIVTVKGFGTVKPKHEFNLTAQVSGKIEWVHPNFVSGGFFNQGDRLLRLEPEDFELAVEQAQAQVANAEYALALAQANAEIALQEWQTMREAQRKLAVTGGNQNTPQRQPDALVLHEPQLKQAEAALASARASLKTAELKLGRTELRAPFNGRIRQETATVGQLANAGFNLASLYSTEVFEIELGLPVSDLDWIEVPGAAALIRSTVGNRQVEWRGTIDRSTGVIDERKRLTNVVIRIDKPLEQSAETGFDLSIGTYVEVEIIGKQVRNVIAIPRHVLHDESTVWLVSPDSKLEIRTVSLARLTGLSAFIKGGVTAGEKIIISDLMGAAQGLKVRPAESSGRESVTPSDEAGGSGR